MTRFPRDPDTRRHLVLGASLALAILLAALLDLHHAWLGMLPGLWAVLAARAPACRPGDASRDPVARRRRARAAGR